MPAARYAIKIGEIRIRASRVITEEDRRRVLKAMSKRGGAPFLTIDGLEIVAVTYPNGEQANG